MPGLLPVVVVLESSQACPTLTEAVAFGLPAWAICCRKSLSSGTLCCADLLVSSEQQH